MKRLKEEELKSVICKDLENFTDEVYHINTDIGGYYSIINVNSKKVIATGKTLEELHFSLHEYMRLKNLTPIEYLTLVTGEALEDHVRKKV